MNKTIARIFGAFLLVLFSFTAMAVHAENINMFAGEVQVLGQVQVDRVAVGSGDVIRAEVLDSGDLLVIAKSAGSSSLLLWNKDGTQTGYNIRVTEKDPETRIHMETMVRMKVKIIEFRKAALGKLGIKWSDEIAGPTFATVGDAVSTRLFRPPVDAGLGIEASDLPSAVKPFSTYFGIATSITSKINYLASTGDAITLAEPTLSCVNGGRAKFLAGGEIPYPVIGNNGQASVEFKEYGVRLDMSPFANEQGEIRTRLLTEVSQIDASVTVLGAPGLLSRRTETEVNVMEGQTIVISGLLNAENSKDYDKVAGLGNLPLLGALFRSKDYKNNLTELVIFVTPEVQRPREITVNDNDNRLLNNSRERLKLLGEKLDYEIMD